MGLYHHATIEISGVNKHYGDLHVLKDVDLTVEDGQVLVVLGPSGSGKSTLLRVINGLEDIQTGQVLVNSQLFNAPKRPSLSGKQRAEVGMVFQQFSLYPHKTALDNVTLSLRKVKKMGKAEAAQVAQEHLAKVNLADKLDCYPAQLSGGEQQRVAIARSLAMQPKVMLFDEPTSALDVELINEVLDTMVQLSREGMTMVVVTHELHFAQQVATKVAFMEKGEVIEVGSPDEVIGNPRMERTQAFMRMINGGIGQGQTA